MRALLKAGAFDVPDAEGSFAETLAGQYGHMSIKALLERAKKKK